MNKDEARSAIMGAISMALKDPTLQLGFELICKEITDLTKENAELKEELKAIDKAGEHVRQQINDAFRNKKPYWELEKENEELRHQLNKNPCVCSTEWHCNDCLDQLTKAKDLLEDFICYANLADCNLYIKEQAEQLLKDLEK